MHRSILTPCLATFLALGSGSAAIAADEPHQAMSPDQLEWGAGPDFIEPGAEMVVLDGNPGEEPFTARLRLPAGYDIHSHSHTEPKYLTVIEGAMHIGFGPELDKSGGMRMPAGSFVKVPPDHMHYEWFEEETVLQVHMNAPITVIYTDPELDPRD